MKLSNLGHVLEIYIYNDVNKRIVFMYVLQYKSETQGAIST